jgi:hypothetical protein
MKPVIKWMAIPVLAAGLLAPAHLTLAQDSSSSPDAKDATKTAAKDVGKGTRTAADKTADGTKNVAKETAKGTKAAAKGTVKGTKAVGKDVGKGTKKVFHGNTGTADDSASSKPKPPSQ